MMIKFIEEQLETEPKVVVFCHHRAVAKALHDAFPGCAFVIGGLPTTKREAERRRFQEDPECRVFVGNIESCCENMELSAADVVVFCELVWKTALLDQAEERVWLPGKTTPIQIFRLVVAGSASADMAALMELRQEAIERATVARRMAGVVT
jgi:SWI/SNF-related matrix-associated actin-dependent regulator 1 of chromatin subfamily A